MTPEQALDLAFPPEECDDTAPQRIWPLVDISGMWIPSPAYVAMVTAQQALEQVT